MFHPHTWTTSFWRSRSRLYTLYKDKASSVNSNWCRSSKVCISGERKGILEKQEGQENTHCLFQRPERWYQIKGQFNSLTTATIKAVPNYPSFICLLFSKAHRGSFLPQDFNSCCGKYDHQNRILKLLCCLQEVCYRKERGGVFTNRRQIITEPQFVNT